MLKITIPKSEFFDDRTNEFVEIPAQTLQLEHSLVSISKWESKWKKPFLDDKEMSQDQLIDYVKCMTLTQNVRPEVYFRLTRPMLEKIRDYINDSMTATWFSNEKKKPPSRRVVTSELIYCWMFELGIPIECQKWHLNRLMTLIKVCDLENAPKKKMSGSDLTKRNHALNAARKARSGSHG